MAMALFTSSLLMQLFGQDQTFLGQFCITERGNYTNSSTYQANLEGLLSSFSNTTADYGFYNSAAGQVNGIALCRADLTPDTCRDCISNSSHDLRRLCPSYKEAIIYYQTCMFRYSDRSIFGTGEISPRFVRTNPENFPNVTETIPVLQKLLRDLRDQAASGGPLRKYATGEALLLGHAIYVLVQCTPDLQELQCKDCLDEYIRLTQTNNLTGKSGADIVGPSCNIRYELYPFYQSLPDAPPPPPPSPFPYPSPSPTADFPSPAPSNGTTGKGKSDMRRSHVIIVVISTIISIILTICICICTFLRRQKGRGNVENADGIISVESLEFNLNSIRVATENFSDANKLGQGGFGIVYKGTLPNGQEIAVKRLSTDSGQGELEFKNEILLVAKLHHRNSVRLLGFCFEGIERLLIYEFLPNGSLDRFIFDPVRRSQLNWEKRYKIIEGIARGLLYLHEESRIQIIHRDLKASNILLDANMNPKISDFGMARLFSTDQTQGKTSRIVGTYGYMAPEYAIHGNFSVKSDVYSFGVLTLEIMSGQRNSCFHNKGNVEDLLNFAWKSWREGTISNLIDPILRCGSVSEIMRCAHIGLLCVQENVAKRPTMASVVLMLGSNSLTLPVPSRPPSFINSSMKQEISFLLESNLVVTESTNNILGHKSVNDVSITELYPC